MPLPMKHGRNTLLQAVATLSLTLPGASGQSHVLQKYTDSTCTTLDSGVGSQQSWVKTGDHTHCFEIMAGFACEIRCNIKLKCEYGSGSGVIVEDLVEPTCRGAVKTVRPLASYWTWKQASNFFTGHCVPDIMGTYLKFDFPMGTSAFPNCSAQGAVATGDDGPNPNAYQEEYVMQFYTDSQCTEEYTVSTFSTQTSSRFRWKVYRGAEFCYDYIDETPRNDSVVLSRPVKQSIPNFRLVCGNDAEFLGNGIQIRRYSGEVCSGAAAAVEDWRTVFDPMNFPHVTDFFRGKCVRWATYYVKFDKAWETRLYPDCSNWACSNGYCSGGRLGADPWSSFDGPINTIDHPDPGSADGAPGFRLWPTVATALVGLGLS
mmetsp:Transcript_50485/g.117219  ORF Transcript_50485/g.117219 Transcript_50485/m.117219 type:complete len:374 (+) Transcript_50485:89-1210(+)